MAIREDIGKNGEARFTRVQSMANVPYARFKDYVEKLKTKGFLNVTETRIELTESGRNYLKDYEQMKRFLATFGLD